MLRACKNVRVMMASALGIHDARLFQVDAVVALPYKHRSVLLIMAPGEGKSAVGHAALRLLPGRSIVVEPTLFVGVTKQLPRLLQCSQTLKPRAFYTGFYSCMMRTLTETTSCHQVR